jgi:hypothetical protein
MLLLATSVGAAALALGPDRLMPSGGGAAPLTPLGAVYWRQEQLWKVAALAALWAGACALVVAGRLGKGPGPVAGKLAPGAVLGALALDLLVFGARYNPVLPPDVLRRPPAALAFLQAQGPDDRVIGLAEALLPNAGTLFGISDLRVYEPVAHRRFLPFFERLDPVLESDIRSRFYLFVWQPNVDLLSLAGVRWVLASRWDERVAPAATLGAAGLVERYTDAGVAIWENPRARPRAYLADAVVAVPDEASALAALGPAGASSRTAVVEVGSEGPAPTAGRGQVTWEAGAGWMRLGVTAPEGGLLVVNDALYPGWEARVDGTPAGLLPTNYLFMGVALAPGDHEITLDYRPPAVLIGAALSAVVALALGVVSLVRVRRFRSR